MRKNGFTRRTKGNLKHSDLENMFKGSLVCAFPDHVNRVITVLRETVVGKFNISGTTFDEFIRKFPREEVLNSVIFPDILFIRFVLYYTFSLS